MTSTSTEKSFKDNSYLMDGYRGRQALRYAFLFLKLISIFCCFHKFNEKMFSVQGPLAFSSSSC